MTYQPQHFTAPDGTRLVIITEDDFNRLNARSGDADDIAQSMAALARHAEDGAEVPAEVMDLLLDGSTPIRAWRLYRGMTQAALAAAAGMSQAAINALELQHGRLPRPKNKLALAKTLDVPVRALEIWADRTASARD